MIRLYEGPSYEFSRAVMEVRQQPGDVDPFNRDLRRILDALNMQFTLHALFYREVEVEGSVWPPFH